MKVEVFEPPKVVEVRHMRLEKDGTRYEAMGFKLENPSGDKVSFGSLGTVDNGGWLVVSHLYRKAYLFQPKGYLDPLYVAEKMNLTSYIDAENLTELLRKLIDRK